MFFLIFTFNLSAQEKLELRQRVWDSVCQRESRHDQDAIKLQRSPPGPVVGGDQREHAAAKEERRRRPPRHRLHALRPHRRARCHAEAG